MKSVLVLSADYPDTTGRVPLMYVHTRNKYYIQHNIDVTVLNFHTDYNYVLDGIKVISLNSYENNLDTYDTLILHAANLRNHYRFLRKYEKRFSHLIFFFHGHEVLRMNKAYPKPYDFVEKNGYLHDMAQEIYDSFKLHIWRKYLPTIAPKSDFIFVSNWFFREFEKYMRLTKKDLLDHVHIIHNSVGKVFEENTYQFKNEKRYDFVTVRSVMDNSKYCIDLVTKFARKYPQYLFLIIGCGNYFRFNKKPENVVWIDKVVKHQELLEYLNQSRCGLFPTRLDAQGVMMCELAAYGMPVITSDIDVCREVFDGVGHIELINNDINLTNLDQVYNRLISRMPYKKCNKFSYESTVKIEENLIKSLGGGYDFITIRSVMDETKYGIDIVVKLAEAYPQYRFLIIGKGLFFDYRQKPDNITWYGKSLTHEEILYCLDHAKCALMPTRQDTQGVMTCEFATYGIPVITSDLEVCREMCGELELVEFIENSAEKVELEEIYTNLLVKIRDKKDKWEKPNKFCYDNTVKLEEDLIKGEK